MATVNISKKRKVGSPGAAANGCAAKHLLGESMLAVLR